MDCIKKNIDRCGTWIITGEETGAGNIKYVSKKCSCCGWEHSLVIPEYYCPNCGAMMGGEKSGL